MGDKTGSLSQPGQPEARTPGWLCGASITTGHWPHPVSGTLIHSWLENFPELVQSWCLAGTSAYWSPWIAARDRTQTGELELQWCGEAEEGMQAVERCVEDSRQKAGCCALRPLVHWTQCLRRQHFRDTGKYMTSVLQQQQQEQQHPLTGEANISCFAGVLGRPLLPDTWQTCKQASSGQGGAEEIWKLSGNRKRGVRENELVRPGCTVGASSHWCVDLAGRTWLSAGRSWMPLTASCPLSLWGVPGWPPSRKG